MSCFQLAFDLRFGAHEIIAMIQFHSPPWIPNPIIFYRLAAVLDNVHARHLMSDRWTLLVIDISHTSYGCLISYGSYILYTNVNDID